MLSSFRTVVVIWILPLLFIVGPFLSQSLAAEEKNARTVVKSFDSRFVDNGDGTIYDHQTKLMWMKEDYWQTQSKWVNWYTATEFAQRINHKKFAGYSDWRLPTPAEAQTLYDRRKLNMDKDGDKIFMDGIFPKGAGWGTWTSEEKAAMAVVVSYKDEGGQELQDKIEGTDAFLRLVRGPVSPSKGK